MIHSSNSNTTILKLRNITKELVDYQCNDDDEKQNIRAYNILCTLEKNCYNAFIKIYKDKNYITTDIMSSSL